MMADKDKDDWLTGDNKLDSSLILDDPWDAQPDEITGNQPVDKMNSRENEKSSNQMDEQSDTQEDESPAAETSDFTESQSDDFSSEQLNDSSDAHTDVQSDAHVDMQSITQTSEKTADHTDETDPFEEFSKANDAADISSEQAADSSSDLVNEKSDSQLDENPFEALNSGSSEQTMSHTAEEKLGQSDDSAAMQTAENSHGQADENNTEFIDPDSIGFDFDTDEHPEAQPEPFTAPQSSENTGGHFLSQSDNQSTDSPDEQQDETTGSQNPIQSETHATDKTVESNDPFDIWDDMTDDCADNFSASQPNENTVNQSHDQNADIWGDSIWGDEQQGTADTEPTAPAGGAVDDFWDAVQETGQPSDTSANQTNVFAGNHAYDISSGYPSDTTANQTDTESETDDFWNMGDQETDQQPTGIPAEETGYPNEGTQAGRGRVLKIVGIIAAVMMLFAALAGGGVYAYHAYNAHVAEQQAAAKREQEQQSLVIAQNKWDEQVADAKKLLSTINESPVKDDTDVKEAVEALQKTTTANPMTKSQITTALKKLDSNYETANNLYQKRMQEKSSELRKTFDGLVQQADGLSDAPDGDDKKQMQELASKWKKADIDATNYTEAQKAAESLKTFIGKVSDAKKAEEDRKKAEEEQKAAAEAQQQAQSQQQQAPSYRPSYRRPYTPSYTVPAQPQQIPTPRPQQTPAPQPGHSDGNLG
ncbi:MAG: hypothetical protein ACLTUD_10520 [Bifidobacterium catenulatum]